MTAEVSVDGRSGMAGAPEVVVDVDEADDSGLDVDAPVEIPVDGDRTE